LIAASVSNWGAYALAAAAALVRAHADLEEEEEEEDCEKKNVSDDDVKRTRRQEKEAYWIQRCLPNNDEEEVAVLERCVAAGARDGVTGHLAATVDGMPLETSLQCLRDLRVAALSGTSCCSEEGGEIGEA